MRKSAVRSANDEFYDKHPELVRNGKREPLDLCDPKQAALTDAEIREKVKKLWKVSRNPTWTLSSKKKARLLKETYSNQGKVNPEDYYSAYYAHIKRHGLSEKEFPSWHVMRNLLQAGKVPETLSGAKALEKAGQASHEGIWGAYFHTKDSYRVKPGKPVVVPEPMASELRAYAKEHGMTEVPGFSTVDGKTVSDKIGFQASYDGSGNLLHGGDEVGTTDYIAPGSGDGHTLFDVDPHHRGNPNEYFSW